MNDKTIGVTLDEIEQTFTAVRRMYRAATCTPDEYTACLAEAEQPTLPGTPAPETSEAYYSEGG